MIIEKNIRESIKVISLGLGQSNFLGQLYAGIRKQNKNIIIDIDNLKKLSRSVDNDEYVAFNQIRNFKDHLTKKDKIAAVVKILFNKFFYIRLLELVLFHRVGLLRIKSYIIDSIKDKAVVDKFLVKSDYRIFQFHFCSPSRLAYLYYFPNSLFKSKKIICSFWGSDLLRTHGVFNYYMQHVALLKANIITVQSPELGEIIMAKFGRYIKPKIRYALFNLETRLYDLIDTFRSDADKIDSFKTSFGITTPNVIVVGHNANQFNNHFSILKQLDACSEEIKDKITCILPLTYGATSPTYVNDLEVFSKKLGIKCLLLTEFLSWENLALLRLAADIMIHMPESDAMSGAATEAMYAGSLLITGAWLPYGNFRRSGLKFKELKEFTDIPDVIIHYINQRTLLCEEQKTQNIVNIRKDYFPETTSKPWIEIYNELASS